MKIKEFILKNKYYLLFIFLFFFILLFPYTCDDFVWGTYKFDIHILRTLFNDASINGRYLGNLISLIITRNRIIKSLIMGITTTLIIYYIKKISKSKLMYLFILLLIMPTMIFSQSIVWASGFANYAFSTLFLLICLDLLEKKSNNILIVLCFICSSLFMENITVFLFGYTLYLNIRYLIKNKKINIKYLLAFIGSLVGSIIMFSHPSYMNILTGDDTYRVAAGIHSSFLRMMKYNIFTNLIHYGFYNNYVITLFIDSYVIYYYFKNKLDKKLLFLLIPIFIINIYLIVSHLNEYLYNLSIINGIIMIIYVILNVILLKIVFKDKYLNRILLIMLGVLLPLFFVSPVGPRNFFTIYVFEILILLRIIPYEVHKYLKILLMIILIYLVGFNIFIYSMNCYVDIKRTDYIRNNQELKTLTIPRLPFTRNVWWGDIESSYGSYFKEYYLRYYKLDEDLTFEYLDYNIWKKQFTFD